MTIKENFEIDIRFESFVNLENGSEIKDTALKCNYLCSYLTKYYRSSSYSSPHNEIYEVIALKKKNYSSLDVKNC